MKNHSLIPRDSRPHGNALAGGKTVNRGTQSRHPLLLLTILLLVLATLAAMFTFGPATGVGEIQPGTLGLPTITPKPH